MTDNEQHENALSKGYKLNEYEIVRVLGAGGFGITYLAFDDLLNQGVAIKEYLPDDLAVRKPDLSVTAKSSAAKADYQWGLNSFMQEARTLARFQHPNIVRVSRCFKAHGTAYIVMDWVEGETLTAYLNRHGRLNEAELKAVLLPLLDGLEEIHKADFLHRDIKPGNIMIRQTSRQPVLIDFGAARQLVGAKSKSVTALCTPGYAPIEQYSTKGNFGAWTDIYALGAVSYFALCGRNVEAAGDRMNHDELIPAAQLAKGRASPAFLSAIDAALNNLAKDRPQSLAEWRAMFMGEAEIDHRAQPTRPTSKAQAQTAEATPPRAEDRPPNTALKAVAFSLFAIILIGGGGYYYLDQQAQHEAAVIAEREKASAEAERERLAEAKAEREKIAEAERKRIAEEKAEEARRIEALKKTMNTRDKHGRTPLHLAAEKGETEKVRELIKAGAEIEAQNKYGSTPLHEAAWRGQTETALALIKAGAEIEAQDSVGQTPLHYAAWNGSPETALALLKAGANKNARNKNGETPAQIARRAGRTETARAIEAAQ